MSYDVEVVVDLDAVHEANYTSNCSRMWEHALGRSLRDFHRAPCSEAAGPLAAGVRVMQRDEELLRTMEPENKWGDYEGALRFLRELAEAAAAHPTGTVVVCS